MAAKSVKTTKSTKRAATKTNSRVGSTKLAKKSFFKGWMAAIVILLVAVVGYAVVHYSEASNYVFIHHANDFGMSGGRVTYKNNGVSARRIDTGQVIEDKLSSGDISNSRNICTYIILAKNTTVNIKLEIRQAIGSKQKGRDFTSGSKAAKYTQCISVDNGVKVANLSNRARTFKAYVRVGSAFVYTVYGKR